jgi:anaerobic ribonucleoside-triphosphate reductase activating protein
VGALNYFKIDKCSISNGDGIRTVLWLSGCSHDCEGCHNPETHDVSNGKSFDDNAKEELFNILSKPYVDGITFSGGDPLYFLNIREVFKLSSEIREKFPNKTQWLYTGYTWEQIIEMSYENSLIEELINSLDVIVDVWNHCPEMSLAILFSFLFWTGVPQRYTDQSLVSEFVCIRQGRICF